MWTYLEAVAERTQAKVPGLPGMLHQVLRQSHFGSTAQRAEDPLANERSCSSLKLKYKGWKTARSLAGEVPRAVPREDGSQPDYRSQVPVERSQPHLGRRCHPYGLQDGAKPGQAIRQAWSDALRWAQGYESSAWSVRPRC